MPNDDIVISVESLSKQYRLGQIGTGTLSHDLNRWWHRVRGNEDPYLKIGESNDRSKSDSDYIWALKDISFDVKQGEVLGIIGRNGAGKSTLLKILSRVTTPTTGHVKVRGRIASLLEVGTGFHPDLTGRENIFLNGAILGMARAETKRKFDEIVAFSGVEKFIDTPVKRYSSGMYVRLAFAVAAHLDPEILIVDEVLAVGDVHFQKKCLGKMEDVAKAGRTILLVSHNMPTILSLSNMVLLLAGGTVVEYGSAHQVITTYQDGFRNSALGQTDLASAEHYGNGLAKFRSIQLLPVDALGKRVPVPVTGCDLAFSIDMEATQDLRDITVALTIYDDLGNRLIDANTLIKGDAVQLTKGKVTEVQFILKNVRLKPDVYTAGLWMGVINQFDTDGVRYATAFRVEANREDILYTTPFPGVYSCEFEHKIVYQ